MHYSSRRGWQQNKSAPIGTHGMLPQGTANEFYSTGYCVDGAPLEENEEAMIQNMTLST